MSAENEKILVLGASGFIGSHLVERLAKDGHPVRAFGRYRETPDYEKFPNVEYFNGDFLNQSDLELALRGVSRVAHLISTTNPSVSDKDPLVDLSTNVAGSVSLFQRCVENGDIKKILFTSSGGTVYGDEYHGRPFIETDSTNPVSPYGIGKLAIENYLQYFKRKFGQDYTVLRIANPYGGRQRNNRQQGIIPLIINNIATEQPVTVYGDGSMVRDYIFIDDLIDTMVKSLMKDMEFETYNVGAGVGVSINELISVAEDVIGKKAIVEHKEQPATFVQTSVLDNSRIRNEIEDARLTSLYDGLQDVYSNYQRQSNS